jgi:uncharacterized peroxidase-related enzyme
MQPRYRSLKLPFLMCSVAAFAALPALGFRLMPGTVKAASLTRPDKDGTRPAFLLFSSEGSSVERAFVAALPLGRVRVVPVSGLDAAEAKQYRVSETPTLVRLTGTGDEQGRCIGASAISAELKGKKTATCLRQIGRRLPWVEESDRRAGWVYRRFSGGRDGVPDIFKAMSLRPRLMEKVLDLSEELHFSDGYLDRLTKERIATLVSSANHSAYCVGSHAAGLAALGSRAAETEALAQGKTDIATLSPKQQALLAFSRRLTKEPGSAHTSQDIEHLRQLGWSDEQIWEAAFDTSLFNLFNRMAATYRLETPTEGWKPTLMAARAHR